MADHFLDATKKADCISRKEVLELIDNAPIIAGSENETLISAPELSDKVYCLPAADVVEVVRCKECKLMRHDEHGYWCINDYQACLDPEKDYCSRAVRKADNGSEQDEAQSKEGG